MKSQHQRRSSVIFTLLFIATLLTASVHAQNMFRKVNDFDGDGRADFAVTRNENGSKIWYILQSTGGFKAFQFGLDSDKESAGDFDGDGKTDIIVYRKTSVPLNYENHEFWIHQSQTDTLTGRSFSTGAPEFSSTTLFSQDYSGDGKINPAVRVVSSGNEPHVLYLNFSVVTRIWYPNGDIPVRVGDLTGDQKSDVVSYRPLDNLVTIKNSTSGATQNLYFGTAGDQFVPADFDGDGIGDLTVFRQSNGTWWWLRSSDGAIQAAQWGSLGDTPVPADYDGDGKTDLAIWRDGYYWVNGSQNGLIVVNWGLPSDLPVTY